MLGFGRVHEAAGHQELDRDMIRNPAAQLDGAGVGEHADVDFGQAELRVLLHDDDVRAEHDLESAAAGDAVDGGNDGLVEIARVVQAAEATGAPVLIGSLAGAGGFQIPAGAEEAIARAR